MSQRLSDEELNSRLQALKRLPLGTLTITSERIDRNASGYLVVDARCSLCEKTYTILIDNLRTGNTKHCYCQKGIRFFSEKERRLQKRYWAIQQRCENPQSQNWDNYGARGIENHFKSAPAFVAYVLKRLPHPDYKGVHIGRKDNDGHYKKGNIRLETPGVNQR